MAKQFSVFLENKPGRLASLVELFEANQIRILAMGIAEAGNYGIVRCIVDYPDRAAAVLRNANTAVNLTEVLIVEMAKFRQAVKILGEKGINIDYAYTMDGGKIVFKVDDPDKACALMSNAGIRMDERQAPSQN